MRRCTPSWVARFDPKTSNNTVSFQSVWSLSPLSCFVVGRQTMKCACFCWSCSLAGWRIVILRASRTSGPSVWTRTAGCNVAFRAVSLASALCGFDVARARYLLAAPETVLLLRTLSLFLLIFIVVSCFFFFVFACFPSFFSFAVVLLLVFFIYYWKKYKRPIAVGNLTPCLCAFSDRRHCRFSMLWNWIAKDRSVG